MPVDDRALFEEAKAVRARGHAPYSNYFVGAAVLDENGQVHIGCNVDWHDTDGTPRFIIDYNVAWY